MLSICVLLYGPHPELARRVLGSIVGSDPPEYVVTDLRIGLNAVSPETRDYVFHLAGTQLLHLPVTIYEPPRNVGKYPLMRRMFYDPRQPLADHVMWFDDDSYILHGYGPAWWQEVHGLARRYTQIGQRWKIPQRGQQYLGIQAQPWYTGQPVFPHYKFGFCTGGWWVASTPFLHCWNYPFPEIFHNGGDSILGELMRQQQRPVLHYDQGVKINEGGRRGRRGIGVALREEVYPWQNGTPGAGPDLSHHNFDCPIHRFTPGHYGLPSTLDRCDPQPGPQAAAGGAC